MKRNSLTCRSCGGVRPQVVLSLGKQPLANSLLTKKQLNEIEPTFPLDLAFCPDCSLVQITETVPPEILFSNYLYFSSFSDTMLKHAEDIAQKTIKTFNLNSDSLVIELGSNDGYLLKFFATKKIPVLGIEPARNIAEKATAGGIPTLCEFFGKELASKLKGQNKSADIIFANNVLAHIADLNGVIEGIRLLLKDKGIAIIEVPYVKDMIDKCEFDTIYHEHLCYFSLTALDNLFKRHGMLIVDVERISIHGGSLRIYAAKDPKRKTSTAVKSLLAQEVVWGIDKIEFYRDFRAAVENVKNSLLSTIESLHRNGRRIAAYGAAAKGTVLLNYCKIGNQFLDFVVDRSPYKQNRYIPGVHVPILPPSELVSKRPDYTLILAWNLADEIIKQQVEYRNLGGKFIIPIPQVKIM